MQAHINHIQISKQFQEILIGGLFINLKGV
jgi:hypothetical protein